MTLTIGASRGAIVPLFTSATLAGTSPLIAIPVASKNVRIHIQGTGTIAAGTLVIEESLDPDSTSWSNLQTLSLASLTGGAGQVIHIAGTFALIRAKLTSNVLGGGNATVSLVAD